MVQVALFFREKAGFGIEMARAMGGADSQDIARAVFATGSLSAVPAELLDGHKLLAVWLRGVGWACPEHLLQGTAVSMCCGFCCGIKNDMRRSSHKGSNGRHRGCPYYCHPLRSSHASRTLSQAGILVH